MITLIIQELCILLFFACGIAIVADKLKQPYTIALVFAGLAISFLHVTPDIYITHDITFSLILPPLLFYGAMHMDVEALKKNWRSVMLLAVPGVILSTFLIGFLLYALLDLPLKYALLFGALITPTDPISVLAILGSVGAPKRLQAIIEGESLFNDGTGVVLFALILGVVTGHDHFSFGHSMGKFVMVTAGGTCIGLTIGLIAYQTLKKVDDHLHELLITIVLAFGTPLLAEHFHFSGVIAIVVAGLIIGNYGRHFSMSSHTREVLEKFWEVIDFVINSILFIMIGVELQVITLEALIMYAKPIGLTIGAVLLSRALVVYGIMIFRNTLDGEGIPFKWKHVLFWGGLRGSISIALVVGLPVQLPHRELFLILAFSVVLFTLVVQGLTMKPLIRMLGLKE